MTPADIVLETATPSFLSRFWDLKSLILRGFSASKQGKKYTFIPEAVPADKDVDI